MRTKFFYILFLVLVLLVTNTSFANQVPDPEVSAPPTMYSSDSNELVLRGYKLPSQDQIYFCFNEEQCTSETGELVASGNDRSWYKVIVLEEGTNILSLVAKNSDSYSNILNYMVYWSQTDIGQEIPDDLKKCLSEEYLGDREQADTVYSTRLNEMISGDTSSGSRTGYGQTLLFDDMVFINFNNETDDNTEATKDDTDNDELADTDESEAKEDDTDEATDIESEGSGITDSVYKYYNGILPSDELSYIQDSITNIFAGKDGIYCMNKYKSVVTQSIVDNNVHTNKQPKGEYDDDGNFIPGTDTDSDGDISIDWGDVGYEYEGEECKDGSIGNCPCGDDEDCAEGLICTKEGICTEPECESASECNSGICDKGRCVDCKDDNSCKTGNKNFCSDYGECVECADDKHCGKMGICENEKCKDVECKSDADCVPPAGHTARCSASNVCTFFQDISPISVAGGDSGGCPQFYVKLGDEIKLISSALHANNVRSSEREEVFEIPFDIDTDDLVLYTSTKYKELFFMNNISVEAVIHPNDKEIYVDTDGKYYLIANKIQIEPIDTYHFAYPWKLPYYYGIAEGFFDIAEENKISNPRLFDIFIKAGNYLVSTIIQKQAYEFLVSDMNTDIYLIVEAKLKEKLFNNRYLIGQNITNDQVSKYYDIVNNSPDASRLMYELTREYMSIIPERWENDQWVPILERSFVPDSKPYMVNLGDNKRFRLVTLENGYDMQEFELAIAAKAQDFELMKLSPTYARSKDIISDTVYTDIFEYDDKRVVIAKDEVVETGYDLAGVWDRLAEYEGYTVTFFVRAGGYYEIFREK